MLEHLVFYNGLIIPLVVVVLFNGLRIFHGLGLDYGTDLMIVLFTFDITVAFGLLQGLDTRLPAIAALWWELAVAGSVLSGLTAWLSIVISQKRFFIVLPSTARTYMYVGSVLVTLACYVPALVVIFLHAVVLTGRPDLTELVARVFK